MSTQSKRPHTRFRCDFSLWIGAAVQHYTTHSQFMPTESSPSTPSADEPSQSNDDLTKAEVYRKVPGFHPDSGEPCTCGVEHLSTSKSLGYSDFVTYTHTCRQCGNTFSTYIEG